MPACKSTGVFLLICLLVVASFQDCRGQKREQQQQQVLAPSLPAILPPSLPPVLPPSLPPIMAPSLPPSPPSLRRDAVFPAAAAPNYPEIDSSNNKALQGDISNYNDSFDTQLRQQLLLQLRAKRRSLQEITYPLIVGMQFFFSDGTTVNPNPRELRDLIRLTDIFYTRVQAQEFSIYFVDCEVQTGEGDCCSWDSNTLVMALDFQMTFRSVDGVIPSFDEVVNRINSGFVTDEYLLNFVNIVSTQYGTTFLNATNVIIATGKGGTAAPTTPGATNPPTPIPTPAPTRSPTLTPTNPPTGVTPAPTPSPTRTPTRSPTGTPTRTPTRAPTRTPTRTPTATPTGAPGTQTTREQYTMFFTTLDGPPGAEVDTIIQEQVRILYDSELRNNFNSFVVGSCATPDPPNSSTDITLKELAWATNVVCEFRSTGDGIPSVAQIDAAVQDYDSLTNALVTSGNAVLANLQRITATTTAPLKLAPFP